MEKCNLCPRHCGAERKAGQAGVCGAAGDQILAARAALHMWEEPCLSGENGSGAVFFRGCPLRCIYCQNYQIAHVDVKKQITRNRLAEIFLELQEQNAANINLVTAAHYVPQVIAALENARKGGLNLPVIYNSSGYEKTETLKMLEGYVDVYLPDFKYLNKRHAKKYSLAEDYPEVAKAAIAEMVRQTGSPKFDDRGMMTKGVIVRHLLLPGCLSDAKKIVEYLHQTYGEQIYMIHTSNGSEYSDAMSTQSKRQLLAEGVKSFSITLPSSNNNNITKEGFSAASTNNASLQVHISFESDAIKSGASSPKVEYNASQLVAIRNEIVDIAGR